jgi:hypothetical protein
MLFILLTVTIPDGMCNENPSVLSSESQFQKVVPKKQEKHSFSGLQLKGALKKPDLSYIYRRRGLRSEQIINIPEHFENEIRAGASQF